MRLFRASEKRKLLRSLSALSLLFACTLAASCARKAGSVSEASGRPENTAAANPAAAAPARTAELPLPSASMKSLAPAESAPRGSSFDSFVPSGAEAPRYPSDYLIGSLGPGSADPAAFAFARLFAAAAAEGKQLTAYYIDPSPADAPAPDAPPGALPATRESEASAASRAIAALGGKAASRVGSPEPGASASVSFLVRFIAGPASVSGELLLGKGGSGEWGVLSFVLGPPDPRGKVDGSPETFDPLTYNRFL